MIFFVGNDGTVINSVPSPVYQGAANANNIYLVAPFAANLQATVAFKLPNGVWTSRYLMTPTNGIEDVINKQTGQSYAGWQFSLPNEITEYYGTVTAQFFFYSAGVITASSSTTFTVGKGVPSVLPDAPAADVYEQILENLSILSQQVNTGGVPARSLFAWNSEDEYKAGELVFYPNNGEYGVFLKSLTDNKGTDPYAKGTLDTANWELITDFNILTGLYTLKADIDQAVQESVENANGARQSADAAQSNAEQSAQSAQKSVQAAQMAESAAVRAGAIAEDMLTTVAYVADVQNGIVAVPKAVSDETGNRIANQFSVVNSDIQGLREDITNEAHFRGYLETNAEVQALSGTPNDYAYSAQSGTVWIYQTATGWTNSGKAVPDQTVPASAATPLMDGTASVGTSTSYARGDHRHPTDTTRASLATATPTSNGLMSAADKTKLDELQNIAIDSALSVTSTNPVQNRAVAEAINNAYSPSNPSPIDKALDVRDVGVQLNKGSGDTYFAARRTDTGNQLNFGVGSGGVNRGIYDVTLKKWIFHTDGTKIYVNGAVPYSSNNPPPQAFIDVTISSSQSLTKNTTLHQFTTTINGTSYKIFIMLSDTSVTYSRLGDLLSAVFKIGTSTHISSIYAVAATDTSYTDWYKCELLKKASSSMVLRCYLNA